MPNQNNPNDNNEVAQSGSTPNDATNSNTTNSPPSGASGSPGANAARNRARRERQKARRLAELAQGRPGSTGDEGSSNTSSIGNSISSSISFTSSISRQFVDVDTGRVRLPIVGEIIAIFPMGVVSSEIRNCALNRLIDFATIPLYAGGQLEQIGAYPIELIDGYFRFVSTMFALHVIIESLISLMKEFDDGEFDSDKLLHSILDDYFQEMNFRKSRWKQAYTRFIKALVNFFLPFDLQTAIIAKFTPISIPTEGDDIISINCVQFCPPDSLPKKFDASDVLTFPFDSSFVGRKGFDLLTNVIDCYADEISEACLFGGEFGIFNDLLRRVEPKWAIAPLASNPSMRAPTNAENINRLNRRSVKPIIPIKKSFKYRHYLSSPPLEPVKSMINLPCYGPEISSCPNYITTNEVVISDRTRRQGFGRVTDRDYKNKPTIFLDCSSQGKLESKGTLELEIPFNVSKDSSLRESNCTIECIFLRVTNKHGVVPYYYANPILSDTLSNHMNLIASDRSNFINVVNMHLSTDELTVNGFLDKGGEVDLLLVNSNDSINSPGNDEADSNEGASDFESPPINNNNQEPVSNRTNIEELRFKLSSMPINKRWSPMLINLSSHQITRHEFTFTALRPFYTTEMTGIWNTESTNKWLLDKVAAQMDSQFKVFTINKASIV